MTIALQVGFVLSFIVCLLMAIKVLGILFRQKITMPWNEVTAHGITQLLALIFQTTYWLPTLMGVA